jgi:hypothetical protein
LYEIIGAVYGGDDTTTFALPNLGSRYLIQAEGPRPDLLGPAWAGGGTPGEDAPVQYVQSVTYAELMALLGAGTLVPGKQYLLTDFQSRWFMVDNGVAIAGSEQSGVVEPLILTAVHGTRLATEAYSTLHRGDVVYYDPVAAAPYLTDQFYSIGGVIISGWKGVITRRVDTLNRVDCPFDWRNLTFRRWAVNPPAWDSATAYVVGNFVKSSNFLFMCIQDNTNQSPFGNWTFWQFISANDLTVDPYLSYSSASFPCFRSLAVYHCPVSSTFQDYTVFSGFTTSNVTIAPGLTTYSALNLVFRQSANGQSRRFSIGAESRDCTIGSGFIDNQIGHRFQDNLLGTGFSSNVIGGQMRLNRILSGFLDNVVDDLFERNLLNEQFRYNRVGRGVGSCITKGSFQNNDMDASITQVNYTGATLVYNTHRKTISRAPDGSRWLTYVATGGTLTTVSDLT